MSEKEVNLITLGTTLENEYKLMRGFKEDNYDEELETGERPKQQNPLLNRQTKQIKLTAEREAQMLKSYEEVCVNDFGDDYHMTDEEKEKRSELYKVFKKMRVCKTKYRRIEDYVRAYRVAIECIKAVSNQDKLFCQNDFMERVLKGKIKVVGLKLPKYIGKDRRYVNWERVSEYILDPELDETDLKPSKGGDIYQVFDSDENEREIKILFNDDELERIVDSKPDAKIEREGFDPDVDNIYETNICVPIKHKEMKMVHKTCPVITDRFKESLKRKKLREDIDGYGFNMADMQSDDLEEIRRKDEKRGFKSRFTPPVFKGDASNKDDVNRFIQECEEYEYTKVKYNFDGNWMTMEEREEEMLKEELDRSGWNIRNLYKYKSDEKKIKKQYKLDSKKEKKLRERLLRVSERNKAREKALNGGKDIADKKKKKSKKVKKLDKKNERRFNDELIERTGMDFSEYEEALFGYSED